MLRHVLIWWMIPTLLVFFAANANARQDPDPSERVALIVVEIDSQQALVAFQRTGLPVYTRWPTDLGQMILSGAGEMEIQRLIQSGLPHQTLAEGLSEGTYYLVYSPPGKSPMDFADYGQVLFEGPARVLLRAGPEGVHQLTLAGGQARAVTLDAKPLQLRTTATAYPALFDPDPEVQDMIDQVDPGTVYTYSGNLTGLWPVLVDNEPYTITTRNTYSGEPIEKATRLVGDHLESLGLDVEYHVWGPVSAPNVIGEITGVIHPEAIYILNAHLDSTIFPPSNVADAPGMDDNASGSIAVLIAADILSQYQWDCTLRFALWTGEEQGLRGSQAYAQRATAYGEKILGVLNLDMIAWNTAGTDPTMDIHANSILPQTLGLANLFVDVIDTYELNLIPEIVPNGTDRSDHASFWDYGYNAILGIEAFHNAEDFNPYYHSENDTYANLEDIPYFIEFIKASLGTFAHLGDCHLTDIYFPVIFGTEP